MAAYDWDAGAYSKASSIQEKWGLELLDKLALRGDERVLDIGCGDGKLSARIAARIPAGFLLGIDSSESMIAFARENYPPERFGNVSWRLLDVREMDFDEEFDLVFSNAVLHWLFDHASVLKKISRALLPGGRVLVQMGGKGNVTGMGLAIAEVMARDSWLSFFSGFRFPYGFYGLEEYTPWLQEAGLEPIRLELLLNDMVFETPEALAAWIRTTWLPFTERIPADSRETFISEVVERFRESNPADEEGRFHLEAKRLEVEAAKSP